MISQKSSFKVITFKSEEIEPHKVNKTEPEPSRLSVPGVHSGTHRLVSCVLCLHTSPHHLHKKRQGEERRDNRGAAGDGADVHLMVATRSFKL